MSPTSLVSWSWASTTRDSSGGQHYVGEDVVVVAVVIPREAAFSSPDPVRHVHMLVRSDGLAEACRNISFARIKNTEHESYIRDAAHGTRGSDRD